MIDYLCNVLLLVILCRGYLMAWEQNCFILQRIVHGNLQPFSLLDACSNVM